MGRGRHSRILGFIEKGLNRFKLRDKIIGLFVFCVMIPLFCVDGIILSRIIDNERAENKAKTENMAESVEGLLQSELLDCQNIATSISQNYKVGELLGNNYANPYDYYEKYSRMTDNYFFQTLVRFENIKIKLYTTNDSVVSGGYVGRVSQIKNTQWFNDFLDSGKDFVFVCEYDDTKAYAESKRVLYYLRKLKFNNNDYDNYIRIDVDYGTVARTFENMGHSNTIYVCDNDIILLSNKGNNNKGVPFELLTADKGTVDCDKSISLNGNINKIIVLSENKSVLQYIKKNIYLFIIVIFISVILPIFVLYEIDYSIVYRIEELNRVFGKRINDELVKVNNPEGSDELGNLMASYNNMVDEVNSLIQVVYKDRLREQEMSLAKKNAELLALHSQINPHFMFNALESIRMHSIIKGENETAEMVEKLAIMERQYVDWDSDVIQVSQEINSVEAYLTLQKYRFGDKLQYELSVDEECQNLRIPKLTIVTFVENACVHGMENKESECWVFVRVYMDDEDTVIEVEDTGKGMSEEALNDIKERHKTVSIDSLKNTGHVGIYNALLRLKLTMGEGYRFEVDSEEGVGTMIQIIIPPKD